ncbi:signal peptidase [Chryseobacterium sp. RP-3-3]|uniref:Signal peptidase n=1 Tax=Chryseobacterium antibioticum TaxID=2728847 RepID=A0A7Y0AMV2_9FLAO|nr:signal peptidase [Chryseobacterium antibioticum]NML70238.1 signal peptidase [Chryseobacterium antibioticum]
MKITSKLLSALFLFAVLLVKADDEIPPVPGGGGTGGVGPGGAASPIDMYVYILSVVAIALILFYTKKLKSLKA